MNEENIHTFKEDFSAWGHENITSSHTSTIEFTSSTQLSKRGDCIIGIKSTKSSFTLNDEIKQAMRNNDSKIVLTIEVNKEKEIIEGRGSKDFLLTNEHDMVCRTSNYIDDRTIMINANKSSRMINRKFVDLLKNPNTFIQLSLIVIKPK
ncbi:MAG: DUF371 domain-containing protein [Candidatus Ranarchaeia archaeon]